VITSMSIAGIVSTTCGFHMMRKGHAGEVQRIWQPLPYSGDKFSMRWTPAIRRLGDGLGGLATNIAHQNMQPRPGMEIYDSDSSWICRSTCVRMRISLHDHCERPRATFKKLDVGRRHTSFSNLRQECTR
ncbi:unnamed protein product, partial [Symbiodinium sp. CCMP2592]